jgi:predicted phage terminase large subunit-like protein
VQLPRPRPDQAEVLDAPERFKNLDAGRRLGKTTTGIPAALVGHGPGWDVGAALLRGALAGGRVWWVVPDMRKTGRDRWRDLKRACRRCWTYKNEVEFRLEFPGGGSLEVRSADDPDSLRGVGLDGVVVDEASLMPEAVWTEALRPALADRAGWALFLYTPKGKAHWTYPRFLAGADPDLALELGASPEELEQNPRRPGWRSWHRETSVNPLISEAELDDALEEIGRLRFDQEFRARFVVAAGDVFRPDLLRWYDLDGRWIILDGDSPTRLPFAGLRRRATVDLAVSTKTSADWTVFLTYGVTHDNRVVVLDLVRKRLEGPDLVPMFRAEWMRHRHARIGVEKVAMQLAIVQEAQRAGLPVVGIPAEKDKRARAEFLAARMDAGAVFLPRHAPWLSDLLAELYEFGDGHAHDDQVDALGYAVLDAVNNPAGGIELSE